MEPEAASDEEERRRQKKERKRQKREREQREADEAVAAAVEEEEEDARVAAAAAGAGAGAASAGAAPGAEDESREHKHKRKEKHKKRSREERDNDDEQPQPQPPQPEPEPAAAPKQYPPKAPEKLDSTILLFYAYCDPPMTRPVQDDMIERCKKTLTGLQITGRLRVAREGFNATLTGPTESMRRFTDFLRKADPATFGQTDFKYVDKQSDNKRLRELKVWPVTEIVTYGFDPVDAPLHMRGTHLTPSDFHKAMEDPNAIMIDVRNFNESVIGRFAPPERVVLDPQMRRSTEFPDWVEAHKKDLEGKKVLMYCTAGVRCERASAFMRNKGVENVYQLEGGIHRYLDAFPQDGGYWVGKNYTFDKRFSHGAEVSEVISACVVCKGPWERYQAQMACSKCQMEVLVCKTCQRGKPKKNTLICPLCTR